MDKLIYVHDQENNWYVIEPEEENEFYTCIEEKDTYTFHKKFSGRNAKDYLKYMKWKNGYQ